MFEVYAVVAAGLIAAAGVLLYRHGKLMGVIAHIKEFGHEVPGMVKKAEAAALPTLEQALAAARAAARHPAPLATTNVMPAATLPLQSNGGLVPLAKPPVVTPVVIPDATPVLNVAPPATAVVPPATQFFDADGTPNPKGQYDARTLKIMQSQQTDADHVFNGPISFQNVTPEEAFYLWQVSTTFSSRYYRALSNEIAMRLNNVHFAVLSGTRAQIASVINFAGSTNAAAAGAFNVDGYHGRFEPLVEAVMAGTLVINW